LAPLEHGAGSSCRSLYALALMFPPKLSSHTLEMKPVRLAGSGKPHSRLRPVQTLSVFLTQHKLKLTHGNCKQRVRLSFALAVLWVLAGGLRREMQQPLEEALRTVMGGLCMEQVRFCRCLFFPYRRLRIQGGQGRGGLGYRFTE
jgi:hypothetical protein